MNALKFSNNLLRISNLKRIIPWHSKRSSSHYPVDDNINGLNQEQRQVNLMAVVWNSFMSNINNIVYYKNLLLHKKNIYQLRHKNTWGHQILNK